MVAKLWLSKEYLSISVEWRRRCSERESDRSAQAHEFKRLAEIICIRAHHDDVLIPYTPEGSPSGSPPAPPHGPPAPSNPNPALTHTDSHPPLPRLATSQNITLGDITYPVPASQTPSRLVHSVELLGVSNPINADNLHLLLQKYLLRQDVFLVSQPGPYARRLALTFASMINAEYEHISIHRDIGETELKQGREIRAGGQLVYVDSPAERAVKSRRILILEGIEKAERGIMPARFVDPVGALLAIPRFDSKGCEVVDKVRDTILATQYAYEVRDALDAVSKYTVPAFPQIALAKLIALAAMFPPPPQLSTGQLARLESMLADTVQKHWKLSTRSLVRIARRVARSPEEEDLQGLITRSLLAEFLRAVERMNLDELLEDAGIKKKSAWFNPSPIVQDAYILFSEISSPDSTSSTPTSIPRFDPALDPEGVAAHIPHMVHFYDKLIQTRSMRELAVDMEVLGEHLALLGNQGVEKNKIIDGSALPWKMKLFVLIALIGCHLLGRPREYIQLHRDTTVNQFMFTTSLERSVIKHTDSPLFRAIIHGRVIIIDKADKVPGHPFHSRARARRGHHKIHEMKFEPTGSTELDEPKEGEHDDKPHEGGNKGSGGRDTAGQGGRGGCKRLYKGHKILQRRLEELNMSVSEAKGYGQLLEGVDTHIRSLHDLLEHLATKEEERVWAKRQTDGELDDRCLTEGITGEATVFKRLRMEKPEIGRPQMKPKRIRFMFDISGSMYRSTDMLMEAFDRVSRKEKYAWDSGDSPTIPLSEVNDPPTEIRDRWKIVEKMAMVTQYTFSGDNTVEAIEKSADEVAKYDADDRFVISITDANFERYQITPDDLKRVMHKQPKIYKAWKGEGLSNS
ncbi:hypothetical protein FIBSPDRAFT_931734 [Athelia psychrophila]|uniref:ATPase dynein-related AAA domain-containing protein n=1 Tax=Athelia psychrophila TaxID=1759441 RepID=A0A166JXH9_9AGAM|nr:hypothetical protein FIBSPDRAFT_931734 [Fibularhizoctonia sp. CBS 109695]